MPRMSALISRALRASGAAWVIAVSFHAAGQSATPPAPAASAARPAQAASAPQPAQAASAAQRARPASAPPAAPAQRIEIQGGRTSDADERRRSTAAKIVIGREEIEKFGDATVGEVLRRLPGVTTPGAPGRGGPPRMRGLGSGFTQLLIDGQRLPPGFSLDSLTPEQIERIEVLRAPTAETGARAIAGTINIITWEGFRRRLNELRLGMGSENGRPQGGVFWTHNDASGDLTYMFSAAVFGNRRANSSYTESESVDTDPATPDPLERYRNDTRSGGDFMGTHLNARLQWRLGEAGDNLTLMPGLFANRSRGGSGFVQDLQVQRPGIERASSGEGDSHNRFFAPRLGAQYRQRVGDWRLDGGGQLSASRADNRSSSEHFRADGTSLRTEQDRAQLREDTWRLNFKGSRALGAGEANTPGTEHSLVMGMEVEGAKRRDTRSTVQDGLPILSNFGDDFEANTLRLAAYVQDEWNLTPQWAVHAGLRWEGITTRGDDGLGNRPTNRNSVATPLVHLLWKMDPKKRDQVRLSLTRSWRAPATNTLIGRPSINRLYDPAVGSNTRTNPDSAGNPNLKPELATGLDLALERFLDGGGLLSANLFVRRITDLMRSEVLLEANTGWSPFDRYVRRTRNIGKANTQGVEFEAKFRLDQVIEGAWPVELRSNAAFYTSKVGAVPGPNNRLDEQAKATANIGADYRIRAIPLTLGANLNWVPSTTTRLSEDQVRSTSTKRQWDVFALWTFSPTVGLRLLANNAVPLDHSTLNLIDSLDPNTGLATEHTRSTNGGPSYTNWQLRLELKL